MHPTSPCKWLATRIWKMADRMGAGRLDLMHLTLPLFTGWCMCWKATMALSPAINLVLWTSWSNEIHDHSYICEWWADSAASQFVLWHLKGADTSHLSHNRILFHLWKQVSNELDNSYGPKPWVPPTTCYDPQVKRWCPPMSRHVDSEPSQVPQWMITLQC